MTRNLHTPVAAKYHQGRPTLDNHRALLRRPVEVWMTTLACRDAPVST